MAQPLIGPGDLIIGSWQNFRRNIKVYADFAVWFVFLSVLQWALWTLVRGLIPDKLLRGVVIGIISIPTAVVMAGLTVAMIDATAKGVQKKAIDMRAALSTGVHRLFPFIWVSILTAAITILGLVLFIIPGLIFLIWYRYAQNFCVLDDVRGLKALSASRSLVSGRWWSVFVRVAVPGFFFYVAGSFFTALAYLLIGAALGDPGLFFGQVTNIDELSNTHTLVTSVIPQLINAFILPLFLGADLMLWFDLKRSPERAPAASA